MPVHMCEHACARACLVIVDTAATVAAATADAATAATVVVTRQDMIHALRLLAVEANFAHLREPI